MTRTQVIDLPLPDAAARRRIASDLEANLLVEAGAGSGKTTSLVARLVSLIASGTAGVDEIAAVTFTRKAAAELRERFQTGLELALAAEREAPEADGLVVERLAGAVDEIDRAFIGTIHSFCGRLLRERPLDVGLDPAFEELPVEERVELRRRYWDSFLERLARDSDPLLEELAEAGVRPVSLFGLFEALVDNEDVHFPTEVAELPTPAEVAPVRTVLERIVENGWELLPERPVDKDSLQKKIRQLHFDREVTGWARPAELFEAMAVLCRPGTSGHRTTQRNWRDRALAKALKEEADAFGVGDTPAQALVGRWYAYRYALAIRLARAAAEGFSAHRLRIGKLDFHDLLLLAARLLRENTDVRRQLGRRYRRLLVDEFQDTDPLQAEIMMLLSSEPAEEDGDASAADWRTAVPRPGALFVVGDPKQSIYRFRRADIQLYGFVKDRFEAFGDVLALSTNFRSRPAIGDLVNQVFAAEDFFPPAASREQAAFERLDTRPPTEEVPREGIFVYDLDPEGDRKAIAARDEGLRIAAWIRDRVASGERTPRDFLILTWARGQLADYARALEAQGLPVAVTGAGVGVEQELEELQVLLRCMIDPTNPVCVVAALVGLFFGFDYERLTRHRLAGGGFDAMRPGDAGHPEVVEAIRTLHGWWSASAREPSDIFIGRIASELGLLPYAASGELGSLRAGALLYALDAVRAAAVAGDTSLPGALEALSAALDLREAEAPLEPGRPDAIRLMNLHQAKGLEGRVVILADPTRKYARRPEMHMARGEDGEGHGYLRVSGPTSGWSTQDLARPIGWPEYEALEERFEKAEEVRLLYVAVTRAMEELVIARWPGKKGSAWEPLHPWLEENATVLELEAREPEAREELELPAATVRARIEAAREALAERGRPTYLHTTVTRLTKEVAGAPGPEPGLPAAVHPSPDDVEFRGFSWGSAVHGALAYAATADPESDLRGICRNLLVEHHRPLDDHGEPVELRELMALVRAVRDSALWGRAQEARRVLTEVSFAVPGVAPAPPEVEPVEAPATRPETGRRQLDLFGEAATEAEDEDGEIQLDAGATDGDAAVPELEVEGATRVLEGVIDLAFRERGGWVIADYKTDVGTDPEFPARAAAYRRQVDLYAEAWHRLTGEPVKERVLFFTAQNRMEQW